MSSAARLSVIGSKTLTLAMERQRLLSISPPSASPLRSGSSSSIAQITRNLATLRDGIAQLEQSQGISRESKSLREQYASIVSMLSDDEVSAAAIPELPPPPEKQATTLLPPVSTTPPASDSPYQDDPSQSDHDMLHQQRQIMRDQDTQLEDLSQSIGRQHHISLQINDELEEHAGLLNALDEDMDRTGNRLNNARRTLDKVSRGAKDNCSTLTIAMVILILLLMIIIFKT